MRRGFALRRRIATNARTSSGGEFARTVSNASRRFVIWLLRYFVCLQGRARKDIESLPSQFVPGPGCGDSLLVLASSQAPGSGCNSGGRRGDRVEHDGTAVVTPRHRSEQVCRLPFLCRCVPGAICAPGTWHDSRKGEACRAVELYRTRCVQVGVSGRCD